jgi:hypothetical protein
LKFTWRGRWKDGEISLEATTIEELESALKKLDTRHKMPDQSKEDGANVPEIPSMLGCTDAVRTLMEKDWGKTPRTMTDIKSALETNQLFFSKGALSATLVTLTKKSDIRRVKEEGKWKYFSKFTQANTNS